MVRLEGPPTCRYKQSKLDTDSVTDGEQTRYSTLYDILLPQIGRPVQ